MKKCRWFWFAWLLLALASNIWRFCGMQPPALAYGEQAVKLKVVYADHQGPEQTRLVFREHTPEMQPTVEDLLNEVAPPAIVLLHGSPGSLQDFDSFAEKLPDDFRVLIPDLPGFGGSWAHLPDYSPRAHAEYLAQFLEKRALPHAHLLAFSMGSAVALEFAHRFPEKVDSLTFVGGVGVQELELFGSYALNHAVHGVQLFAIASAEWLLPHFGLLDYWPLNYAYARNFFDSDQRPYRQWLLEYQKPMLLLHGVKDFLVPVEAAYEHHRLVPQSELRELSGSHFLLWTQGEAIAQEVEQFVRRVEEGKATVRTTASRARIQVSQQPFDSSIVPSFSGPALWLAMLLLALATLVSEDLTCIATGLLVAQGRISLVAGSSACFFGILLGDMLLFLAGRSFGRKAIQVIPLRWMLTPAAVDRASAWFRKQGAWVIFISRFLPGLRLPTYFAVGILKTKTLWFFFYFSLAGIFWTPTLVWLSSRLGLGAEALLAHFQNYGIWILLGVLVVAYFLVKILFPLCTFRGRRNLAGKWRRLRHWEYCSRFRLYLPVLPTILHCAWRTGGLRLVTAANPGMEGGGVVGESKNHTLQAISAFAPKSLFCPRGQEDAKTLEEIRCWMEAEDVDFPIVAKPNAGERGFGVCKVKNQAQLSQWLQDFPMPALIQEWVSGVEFGISVCKLPGQSSHQIVSITRKKIPTVTGDGKQTLEQLILKHPRHIAHADFFLGVQSARLFDVPSAEETIVLSEFGTHSKGAEFVDAESLLTPSLQKAIAELSAAIPGFFIGRFDLKVPSTEDLKLGKNIRIIEVNGLTGEPAHIYDSRYSIKEARRVLRAHWQNAFAIAQDNLRHGAKPTSWSQLWKLWRNSR